MSAEPAVHALDPEELVIVAVPDTHVPLGRIGSWMMLHDHIARGREALLPVDGREFDPAVYPELKALLDDRFGVNRLPDLRMSW